jgi:hypothetical protein
MLNPAGSVYRLPNEHDSDDVQERLTDYNSEVYSDDVGETLVTTIGGVKSASREFKFEIEFDYVEKISVRGRDEPLSVKGAKQATGMFCKDLASDGFVLVGPDRRDAAGLVSSAIEGGSDNYDPLNLPPSVIAKVVRNDSEDARYKIWEDIDTFTDLALIGGALEDSTYSQDFDDQGQPIWVMFDSRSTGRLVGVSRTSIVIYGNGVSPTEIESYYYNSIKPEM